MRMVTMVVLLGIWSVFGTTNAGEDLILRRFSTEDGLPDNNIQAIAQSAEGYLWIGTPNGLARFDGVKFKPYQPSELPPGCGDAFPALAVHGEEVWIGTNDGLLCRRNGGFVRYSTKNGLPSKKIFKLHAAVSGDIWMETDTYLTRFTKGEFIVYRPNDAMSSTHALWFASLPGGETGLGTESGAYQHHPESDTLTKWTTEGLGVNYHDLTGLVVDPTGECWVGSRAGLFWRQNGHWSKWGVESGLSDPWITFAHRDRSGTLWVGTRNSGLYRWTGSHFDAFNLNVDPHEYGIRCLFEDSEGGLWIGTNEGLIQLRHRRFKVFGANEGIVESRMRTVCAAPDGSVWTGGEGAIAQIKNDTVAFYLANLPEKHHGVRSILADQSGRLWWTTYGLYQLVEGKPIERFELLHESRIFGQSLYQDRMGSIWIGHDGGVVCIDSHGTTRRFGGNGSSVWGAECFLEDRVSGMWVGSKNGLNLLTDGEEQHYGLNHGLSDNSVTALYQDQKGILWVGTHHGLNRFDGRRFKSITASNGLAEDWINCILSDGRGFLWLSGMHGIHRVKESDLNEFADRRTTDVPVLSFGEIDGLPSSETGGGWQPAGCKGTDGRLWFPTSRGVAAIDPASVPTVETQPHPIIEQVVGGGQLIYLDGVDLESRTLAPNQPRTMDFSYTAPTLNKPTQVRFRHRLRGASEEWEEVGPERRMLFPNVAPGNYRFEVEAATPHGRWSDPPTSFSFTVSPRFVETPWFPISLTGTGAIVIGALAWWRMNWQRRILLAQHWTAMESDRSRIARNLHDHLGASITAIGLQIDVVSRSLEARSGMALTLSAIAQHARDAVDEIREAVWTLNPECDTLDSFASFIGRYAERFLAAAELRCRLSIENPLPAVTVAAEVRLALYLAVKEALTNVAKHANASEVRISLLHDAGAMSIVLEDNGRGTNIEILTASARGFANIRKRLDAIGGQFLVTTQPGMGVRITLRVQIGSSA